MTDARYLVAALADVGFGEVEVFEIPHRLYGYRGDLREQMAEVIIRRKHVGQASNDIGFRRSSDGTFEALISAFDRRKYSPQWLGQLAQRYAYHAAKAKSADQGFTLVEENVEQNGRIHLVLRRIV